MDASVDDVRNAHQTKIWLRVAQGIASLAMLVLAVWLLWRYEYLQAFGQIDNFLGALPVIIILLALGAALGLIWVRKAKSQRPLLVGFTIFLAVAVAVFPTALRADWWIFSKTSDAPATSVDLSGYAPFTHSSTLARLDQPATIQLRGDLPRLDGATALYPVYAALAEASYAEADFHSDLVKCTNTANAYQSLINGQTDVIFVAAASAEQLAAAQSAGVELCFTPIGREAFVFVVGGDNPIDNLTTQQIHNIYSGKTANWATLGWSAGGRMIVYQRPAGSGSQTGLLQIMGDLPVQAPQPLPDASLIGSNSLMRQVSVTWQGVQPAIGYSYRYYATTMNANPDTKLLQVDGCYPSVENIQSDAYPFVSDFYAVTVGEPTGNTADFIQWILSEQGQQLIEASGYVPLPESR
ncbi:MAG: substrate-binding domain-containing protein [Actinomycetia bacterium]|nr:substrate-binding domain-containing protein [Actinomycetes bacterium]